jgi:hypothetical protein
MGECVICDSSLKPDLERMILSGANDQHIQSWARERNLKLSNRTIETHKVKHYGYVEKTSQSIAEFEAVNQTYSQIESLLNLGNDELLGYFSANNLKPHHRKKYNLIDILRYFTQQLSSEVERLQQKLKQLTPTSQKLAMAQLKEQKLEAQTELLTAVASTKELELKLALGRVVRDKQLEERWSYSLVGFRAKLESIPNKLALELSAIDCNSNVSEVLRKSISEALSELENESR